MSSNTTIPSNTFLRSVNVLFLALVGGQVIFALVFLALRLTQPQKEMLDKEIAAILIWVAPAAALGGVMLGYILFQSKMKLLRDKNKLSEKLDGYRSAMIIRLAMMEGPSLFALILFYVTGNYIFLGTAAFVILMFLLNRPSKSSIVQQLQLHDDERMMLDDPDAVL